MPRYSDAALLKGEYAHMAAELRAGERDAPSIADWQKTACEDLSEKTAQAVGQQIFDLQATLDPETERLEIAAMTAGGLMIVLGLFAAEADMLRLEGHLLNDRQPVAHLVHASQLQLTITKRAATDVEPENDAAQIGFVIFDQLEKRAAERKKPKKKSVAKAKSNKTKDVRK